VHIVEPVEDLSHVLLKSVHRQELSFLVKVLQHVLQAHITKLQNSVLNDSLLVINGVKEVQHLHDVLLATKHVQNLKLSRNNVACFLSSLESYLALSVIVPSFKNVAYF
jgi:hypothetical protein